MGSQNKGKVLDHNPTSKASGAELARALRGRKKFVTRNTGVRTLLRHEFFLAIGVSSKSTHGVDVDDRGS